MAFAVPFNRLPEMRSMWRSIAKLFGHPELSGQWRDGGGRPIGERFALPASGAESVEIIDEDRFRFVHAAPQIVVERPKPDSAVTLAVFSGWSEIGFVDAALIAELAAPGPVDRRRIGSPDAAPLLYIVGDRFADPETFFARARDVVDQCNRGFGPFNRADGRYALAADALFWPSNPVSGNFGTTDPPLPAPGAPDANDGKYRIIQCDGATVGRSLQSAGVVVTDDTLVLVIVASSRRLGAGGLATSRVRGWRPALATSYGPEFVSSVALHELGHSFGLIDEYDTPYTYPVQAFEPNVSASGDWRDAPEPWRFIATGHVVAGYVRKLPDNGDTVGAFKGARYDPVNYFRPSATCMMRMPGAQFCQVCQEIIATEIDARS